MTALIQAEPDPISVDLDRTALVIIDMQRDFLEHGGFGETLGNDVTRLHAAVGPCRAVLDAARRKGMMVVHTREGHLPDLSDAPPAKLERGAPSLRPRRRRRRSRSRTGRPIHRDPRSRQPLTGRSAPRPSRPKFPL